MGYISTFFPSNIYFEKKYSKVENILQYPPSYLEHHPETTLAFFFTFFTHLSIYLISYK